MTKLSELADDVMVFQDEETPISIKDLRHEMEAGFEKRTEGWQVAQAHFWTPSAESMIESYADNESVDLYEGAYERLMDELSPHIEAIQKILAGIEVHYWVETGEYVEVDGLQGKRVMQNDNRTQS